MKKFLTILLFVGFIGIVYYYRHDINTIYLTYFYNQSKNIKLDYKNEYTRNYSYNYIKLTNNFKITGKQHLLDTYYTILNSGIPEFTFYCSKEYSNCINDVVEIANSQVILSNINSFVHPFNSFSSIETNYDNLGKITLKINKAYSNEQIDEINNKVKDIIANEIKNTKEQKEIIKIIHDYIINNSKYDSEKSDKNIDNYASNIAYGPLIEGYGLCGGYTDSMAIFLDYYDIPNFKIISENHVWNAVYLDDEWYHLDLTWDDPVVSDGSNILEYNFFLIDNKELEELETNQHIFDKNVFTEILNNN